MLKRNADDIYQKRIFTFTRFTIALYICLNIILTPAHARINTSTNTQIDYIIEEFGLNAELNWIKKDFLNAQSILGEMQKNNQSTQQLKEYLNITFKEKLSDTRVKYHLKKKIGNNFTANEIKMLIVEMETDAWRRAKLYETITHDTTKYTTYNYNAMQNYIKKLKNTPPRSERKQLIEKLINTKKTADLMLEINIQSALLTSKIMLEKAGKNSTESMKISASTRKKLEYFRKEYSEDIESQMLYMYRHMPDHQLATYINISSSPLVNRLNQLTNQTLVELMQ